MVTVIKTIFFSYYYSWFALKLKVFGAKFPFVVIEEGHQILYSASKIHFVCKLNILT